jgi:hypothetical protein
MATTTTNLSLRKPEGTDNVSVTLDIANNMQTLDDKWASSTPNSIGDTNTAGSALTVARSNHVHAVDSGSVSAPGLPVGEANTGLYRSATGELAVTLLGTLAGIFKSTGLWLENALVLAQIATPSAPSSGYTALYSKSGGKVYRRAAAGSEVEMADYEGADAGEVLRASGWGQVQNSDLAGSIGNSKLAIPLQSGKAVGSTSAPSTSSTSMVDLTDMSVTLTTTGGKLDCSFVGGFQIGAVPNGISVQIVVDGSLVDKAMTAGYQNANTNQVISVNALSGALSAGSHTVKVQWSVTGGTGTATGTGRTLIVREIPG